MSDISINNILINSIQKFSAWGSAGDLDRCLWNGGSPSSAEKILRSAWSNLSTPGVGTWNVGPTCAVVHLTFNRDSWMGFFLCGILMRIGWYTAVCSMSGHVHVVDILDIRFYFAHGCHSNGEEYTLMQSSRSQIAWKSSSKKVSPCDNAMEQLHLFGNM